MICVNLNNTLRYKYNIRIRMILTREIILEEIKNGTIGITPFDAGSVGPASVDLRLGNAFRRFKHLNHVFNVTEDASFEDMTEEVVVPDGEVLLIKPGETILGVTVERITLSPSICGWLEGRSRFARLGLAVHVTSGFMQPGINNHQVLEMTNLSPTPLALVPGVRLCQFVFQRCEGEASYTGRFQGQEKP